MAIPIDVSTEPAVVKLTKNAPIKMPGQTPYPKINNAAIAIPVHGHTAVALACTDAICNPSLPATKYTTARPATIATLFSASERVIAKFSAPSELFRKGSRAPAYTNRAYHSGSIPHPNTHSYPINSQFTRRFTLTGTPFYRLFQSKQSRQSLFLRK